MIRHPIYPYLSHKLHGAGIFTYIETPKKSPNFVGFYIPAPWSIWVCKHSKKKIQRYPKHPAVGSWERWYVGHGIRPGMMVPVKKRSDEHGKIWDSGAGEIRHGNMRGRLLWEYYIIHGKDQSWTDV